MYDHFYELQTCMVHVVEIYRGVIIQTADIIVSLPKPKERLMSHIIEMIEN